MFLVSVVVEQQGSDNDGDDAANHQEGPTLQADSFVPSVLLTARERDRQQCVGACSRWGSSRGTESIFLAYEAAMFGVEIGLIEPARDCITERDKSLFALA